MELLRQPVATDGNGFGLFPPFLRPLDLPLIACGVPKLVSCLQIGNFSARAPNFGTPQASDPKTR
jgi:hypothetical protein